MTLTTDDVLDRLVGNRPALVRRQAEADRVIAASGAAHLVHEMNVSTGDGRGRPWRIDPIPVVLDGATFDALATDVVARVRALERILADLYGPRHLVRDGVVPGEALSSTPRYRMGVVGTPAPARWLTTYAVDVVSLADGSWRIAQDLTDAPTGLGYALLDRSAMMRVADEILGPEGAGLVASLTGVGAELRHALAATTTVPSPRIVLFSGGIDHPGYVEHSSLARLLGYTLVERPDLVIRQGRLWLRALAGLDPIDVVYRRVEDHDTDAIEISGAGGRGVPGLLSAVSAGGLVLANAHGSGVIEEADLAGYWDAAAESLTGSSLRLTPLVAGQSVALAERPAFRNGDTSSATVVVRLHAIVGPDEVTVVPGGNGRVLAPGDDPRNPSAHVAKDVWVIGSERPIPLIVAPLPQVDLAQSVPTRAADALFWTGRALERAESIARTIRVVSARRRQDPVLVTFDGARWAFRMAAALRAVRAESLGGGESDSAAVTEYAAPAAAASGDAELRRSVRRGLAELDAELRTSTQAMVARLRAFIADAAAVGEFLPSNTSRVLNTLARLTDGFAGATPAAGTPIDALDDVMATLSAFAGMWSESTVRGPAWRFGDIGIRVERSLVVLDLVSACTESRADRRGDPTVRPPCRVCGVCGADPTEPCRSERAGPSDGILNPATVSGQVPDVVDAASLELLLAANESLVAYRRQYRSDVDLAPTMELLLRNRDNPRGYLSCLDRLAEHVADVDWPEGSAKVALLAEMVSSVSVADLVGGDPVVDRIVVARDAVVTFANQVVERWFATPVKPMLVRAGPP